VCSAGPYRIPRSWREKFFGESVRSLRALLKRYVPYGTITPTSDLNNTKLQRKEITALFPTHPPCFGLLAGASANILLSDTNTLFRHFRIGFVGMRGGSRVRFSDPFPAMDMDTTTPHLSYPAQFRISVTRADVASLGASMNATAASWPHPGGGASAVFTGAFDETPDVELPDYNISSFRYALDSGGDTVAGGIVEYASVVIAKPVTDMTKSTFTCTFAVADDFEFIHWQGFPPMYLVA